MERGEVWWAHFDERRPVVLLSPGDAGAMRAIQIVPPAGTDLTGVAIEVALGRAEGLPQAGVVRVALARPGLIPCTWLATVTREDLIEQAGTLSPEKLGELAEALRRARVE